MTAAAHWVVIPAAGIGKRMNAERPKQYLSLGCQTVIEHTLDRFLCVPQITGIVVALDPRDAFWPGLKIVSDKPLLTVAGGKQRCHSVLNALEHLADKAELQDWVLVHDAARPCLSNADLLRLIDTLDQDPVGGILAAPVRDTIKRDDAQLRIAQTIDRSGLWHALTPQMFRLEALSGALRKSLAEDYLVTDEASAMEYVGLRPRLVEGRTDNIKITRPEDLSLAEYYLDH
ncbi:MAG: 2-C-methyl-D-erythritol 4-phosphate cytidylyltransferase [Gammaproteobacteria bacterium]|nr:2-C-methyl-D-erythritol 4-phosphate cytidylyltransferase [Gammaproteobacteria bacterium]